MLNLVKVKPRSLEDYQKVVGRKAISEIKKLAQKLEGQKVVHINATPFGGGVAEILRSLTPLMNACGIKAQWYSLAGNNEDFFKITKEFHNALQGERISLPESQKKAYLARIKKIAQSLPQIKADIWIIHDPQPLALIDYLPSDKPTLWRCHIDTSDPNPEFWRFLKPYIKKYDQVIFSLKDYVNGSFDKRKVRIVQPAIDPLLKKNSLMPLKAARELLQKFDLDPKRPLMAQISRFDPWKDPQGVVKAYKLAKKEIPKLQLAYFGLKVAQDDPQAEAIYLETEKMVGPDPDIHLFFNPKGFKLRILDEFVRAGQSAAEVIVQKSIREGFGLTVTEAMWKSKPVIGGNVGGIRLQIQNGYNGFLVNSIEECAEKMILLLKNKKLRKKIGKRAKEPVKEKYLITRLLKDYLKILADLI